MSEQKIKYDELIISDDIKLIVKREVAKLKKAPSLEPADFIKLEKLSKVYSLMMADTRENIKHNVFGNTSTDDLEDIDDFSYGGDASDDGEHGDE